MVVAVQAAAAVAVQDAAVAVVLVAQAVSADRLPSVVPFFLLDLDFYHQFDKLTPNSVGLAHLGQDLALRCKPEEKSSGLLFLTFVCRR